MKAGFRPAGGTQNLSSCSWWGWWDLNPQALRHMALNHACLPISPHPLIVLISGVYPLTQAIIFYGLSEGATFPCFFVIIL